MRNHPNAFSSFKRIIYLERQGQQQTKTESKEQNHFHAFVYKSAFCHWGRTFVYKPAFCHWQRTHSAMNMFLKHLGCIQLTVLVLLLLRQDTDRAEKGIYCRLLGVVLRPHPAPAVLQCESFSLHSNS